MLLSVYGLLTFILNQRDKIGKKRNKTCSFLYNTPFRYQDMLKFLRMAMRQNAFVLQKKIN
jgi:hypothetical protein